MYFLDLDHVPAAQGANHLLLGYGSEHAGLALYSGVFLDEELLLLGLHLVDDSGHVVADPLPSVWYFVDAAWCLAAGEPPGTAQTGMHGDATFDRVYAGPGVPHTIPLGGRTALDLGFSPDGDTVFLGLFDAAIAFWRVLFPAPGTYTLTLDGLGDAVYTVAEPVVLTPPFLSVLRMDPLNRASSAYVRIAYAGAYPAGGLDIPEGAIGRPSYLFADVNADPPYRFTYSGEYPQKLRVYVGDAEAAAGAVIDFTTLALFIGP